MTLTQATAPLPTTDAALRAELTLAQAAECNAPKRAAIYAARAERLTEALSA